MLNPHPPHVLHNLTHIGSTPHLITTRTTLTQVHTNAAKKGKLHQSVLLDTTKKWLVEKLAVVNEEIGKEKNVIAELVVKIREMTPMCFSDSESESEFGRS